jgi:hypothetical protein
MHNIFLRQKSFVRWWRGGVFAELRGGGIMATTMSTTIGDREKHFIFGNPLECEPAKCLESDLSAARALSL